MMKLIVSLLTVLVVSLAGPAMAQVRPQPGEGDPRLQTVDYDAGQVVQLEGAPGYQLTVELSPDEQVQNVAVGDSGAWNVSVNRAGDHLFVKPAQADVPTNMTVITTVRVYNFDLLPLAVPTPDMAYTVRFKYPAPATAETSSEFVDVSGVLRRASRYRIGGDRLLRPALVTDDGKQTYISWPVDRALPATYAIRETGEEVLVNGAMRGDDFVIDGVPGRLIFRIDGRTANAERLVSRRRR